MIVINSLLLYQGESVKDLEIEIRSLIDELFRNAEKEVLSQSCQTSMMASKLRGKRPRRNFFENEEFYDPMIREVFVRKKEVSIVYELEDGNKEITGIIGRLIDWMRDNGISDMDILDCIKYICEESQENTESDLRYDSKAYRLARKNAHYNDDGQVVIVKDDEWREEYEWDEIFKQLQAKENSGNVPTDKAANLEEYMREMREDRENPWEEFYRRANKNEK